VVYFTAEDDPADTLRPRLEAAGGDPSRLLVVTTIHETDDEGRTRERLPNFRDLAVIARAITRVHARLVVFDPFMAYLDRETSSFRDQDVRAVLTPLARVAARTGAAFLLIRHLNKAVGGSALYRGGGSIGIIGAARSGLLAARDPDDPARCVLASVKNNLGPPPPALAYSIVGTTLPDTPGGPGSGPNDGPDGPIAAPRVVWHGESARDADELLAPPGMNDRDEESSPQTGRGMVLLPELLADGPRPEVEVRRAAVEAAIGWTTMKRAKRALGVVSRRESAAGSHGGGCWRWALPPLVGTRTTADAHADTVHADTVHADTVHADTVHAAAVHADDAAEVTSRQAGGAGPVGMAAMADGPPPAGPLVDGPPPAGPLIDGPPAGDTTPVKSDGVGECGGDSAAATGWQGTRAGRERRGGQGDQGDHVPEMPSLSPLDASLLVRLTCVPQRTMTTMPPECPEGGRN
jgi:hypothetical protein